MNLRPPYPSLIRTRTPSLLSLAHTPPSPPSILHYSSLDTDVRSWRTHGKDNRMGGAQQEMLINPCGVSGPLV